MQVDQRWQRDADRPLLRGWSHAFGAVVALGLTPVFAAHAVNGPPRAGSVVFGLALATCFGLSAGFHLVDWSPPWDLRMKRADHIGIFVLLAGTYSGVALAILDGWLRGVVLAGAWIAVVFGIVGASLGLFERRGAANTSYIALGWIAVLMMPAMIDELAVGDLALLVLGGVVYTAGAVALAHRRPTLWPQTFGYHEVWHVLTLLAAAAHAAVIWSATAP